MARPWALPPDEPIGTYRELIAQQVRETVKENEPVRDVLARFYRRFRCPVCNLFGWCEDRDRASDLRLILRREA